MRHPIRSGMVLVSVCALVAAQGCSTSGPSGGSGETTSGESPSAAALPTLAPQSQNPGPRITLGPAERAGADATKHVVVVFMQNNSFDKLFGTWDQVNGDPVDNIAKASPQNTVQVGQDGKPLGCLSLIHI